MAMTLLQTTRCCMRGAAQRVWSHAVSNDDAAGDAVMVSYSYEEAARNGIANSIGASTCFGGASKATYMAMARRILSMVATASGDEAFSHNGRKSQCRSMMARCREMSQAICRNTAHMATPLCVTAGASRAPP